MKGYIRCGISSETAVNILRRGRSERGKVMLFSPAQMLAAVRYVEQNPVRAGFRPQRWSFVVPYFGVAWLLAVDSA